MSKIIEMKEGEYFEGFCLIKTAAVKTAKNGKEYLDFVFQDKTGEIGGKLWGATSKDIEQYHSGVVSFVAGTRSSYNGTPQLEKLSLRLPEGDEPNNPEDFKIKPAFDVKEIKEHLDTVKAGITNNIWRNIVSFLYQKHEDKFYQYPAAKSNHHAFEGGLCFHTVSMVKLADSVGDLYPQLNKELMFAGIMLHDLAKVIELSGVEETEYTTQGKLIGHINLIDGEIVQAAVELGIPVNKDDVTILRHVVLSHHGKREWGSPVLPQIMEAEVVHMVDIFDAKMIMMHTALQQTPEDDWSARLFGMDGRSFYNSPLI